MTHGGEPEESFVRRGNLPRGFPSGSSMREGVEREKDINREDCFRSMDISFLIVPSFNNGDYINLIVSVFQHNFLIYNIQHTYVYST